MFSPHHPPIPNLLSRGYTYYKIGNLDNRIGNPDQLLTQDVERFCNSVVDLYSNVSKVTCTLIAWLYQTECFRLMKLW